jgi:starch-binding outer membrane protein, SusD/RagB family
MKQTMKNIFNKILLSLTLLAGLSACQDDFYDRKPYNALPVNDAIKNEADLGAAVNGMYTGMRTSNLYMRGIPFMGDILADNVYLSASNSNRYVAQYNYSYNLSNADTGGIWQWAYTVILRANNVINATVPETAISKQLKGEALTVRALMYWELAKWFGRPVNSDANALCVPLILTFDPTLKPARNTTGQIYDQVIKDLNSAYDLMTVSKNSSYVSKFVAKGVLAKVLLYKGDWAGAKAAAQDVVSNGGYSLAAATTAAYNAYWNNPTPVANKLETMFEISADDVANAGFDALTNMYDQGGYGDGLCTKELYDLYSPTDVRRSVLIPGTRAGESVYLVNKYQNIKNNADKDDGKVLRYADILLILAEANFRTNDEVNALKLLNQVAQRRDPAFAAGYASTGAALLEDIIKERRKELAFEGDRFPDLNRLGRNITRNTQYPAAARTMTSDNFRRIMPIPQFEIDANPAIVQNPQY